jgi:hypothetical protein
MEYKLAAAKRFENLKYNKTTNSKEKEIQLLQLRS